ncbi:hypothetical protein [Streptomyces humidus]|uniref:hypothetical protein n=1 Tax=Streptomyces humidus TaxID=52259 RepID=UPI003D9EF9AA
MLAAAAAATAIVGAVVMRHWDVQAGKQVADLTRARAGDEWRFEERVAELESDLEESRELRVKLEQRLRAKRAELAGLRNEHAALLRRYATAETERASALEGRRLLEIEAAPAPALPAAREAQDAKPTDPARAADAADTAGMSGTSGTSGTSEGVETSEASGSGASGEAVESSAPGGEKAKTPAVFSPEGSKLFLRAQEALARLDADSVKASDERLTGDLSEGLTDNPADEGPARQTSAEAAPEDEAQGKPEAVDEHTRATAPRKAVEDDETPDGEKPDEGPSNDASTDHAPSREASASEATSRDATSASALPDDGAIPGHVAPAVPHMDEARGASSDENATDENAADDTSADDEAALDESGRAAVPAEATDAPADGARTTRSETPLDRGPDPDLDPDPDPGPGPGRGAAAPLAEPAAAAEAGAVVRRPAAPVQRPSGHFAVPTAVVVVPAAEPVRRPTAEGGFDFFGTKSETEPDALEAVQNEDLADVVGQEALALHKAESEAGFKPADEAARGVGQVIDLTAHDETEHIDLQGLRSAVS